MGLDDEADVVVGEAVDEPHLPERSGPIQGERLHPAHQGGELLVVARPGERGQADVVVDVEVLVVDPHRPGLGVRHLHHPLPEAGDLMEASGDVVLELVEADPATAVAQRPALDHRQRADVLRFVWRLDPQEHRVGGGQSFVRHCVQSRLAGPTRPGPFGATAPRRAAVRLWSASLGFGIIEP